MSIVSTNEHKEQQQSRAAAHVSRAGSQKASRSAAMAVQMMPEEEEPAQGKFPAQRETETPSEPASGIPESVQTSMEKTLGTSLSDVKVHPNSGKATEVGAMAYTQGTDIHVAPGHYNPGSSSGKQLLGHELAHVAQQMAGRVQPTGSVGGLPLNDSPALEKEADSMGSKAV